MDYLKNHCGGDVYWDLGSADWQKNKSLLNIEPKRRRKVRRKVRNEIFFGWQDVNAQKKKPENWRGSNKKRLLLCVHVERRRKIRVLRALKAKKFLLVRWWWWCSENVPT